MRSMVTFALALCLLIWSIVMIVLDAYARDYSLAARQIEAQKAPALGYFDQIEQTLSGERVLSLCSREIVRSAVMIKLARLDAAYRQEDVTVRSAALASASNALRIALGCFPQDGNLWLRLAMVDHAEKGSADIAASYLKASLAAAPSEAWVMSTRIDFASRLLDSAAPGVEVVLRTDIRNFVLFGRVADVAALYLKATKPAARIFEEQFGGADEARRSALQRAIASTLEAQAAGQQHAR